MRRLSTDNPCSSYLSLQEARHTGVKDLVSSIGKRGRLTTEEGLQVGVLITDARRVYGRVDFNVRPLNGGNATAWVSSERVKLEGK